MRPIQCPLCLKSVSGDSYNFTACLCIDCVEREAIKYGVAREFVGNIDTAKKNLIPYFRDIPKAENLSDVQKVRILILAMGISVVSPTDLEMRGCSVIKGRMGG